MKGALSASRVKDREVGLCHRKLCSGNQGFADSTQRLGGATRLDRRRRTHLRPTSKPRVVLCPPLPWQVSPGVAVGDIVKYRQIYPDNKARHFESLKAASGIAYEDMLFFDDCNWGDNCRDVEWGCPGVVTTMTPNGLTPEKWAEVRRGKEGGEMLVWVWVWRLGWPRRAAAPCGTSCEGTAVGVSSKRSDGTAQKASMPRTAGEGRQSETLSHVCAAVVTTVFRRYIDVFPAHLARVSLRWRHGKRGWHGRKAEFVEIDSPLIRFSRRLHGGKRAV